MANFEAQVRTSYRDVAGLVLSCARADIVEDPSNPGFVSEWINRAPGLPSKPAIRQPGDAVTYLGGRFSNPKQPVHALQPTLALTGGGDSRVQLDRARSTFLQSELLVDSLPDSGATLQRLSCGYQFTKGPDAALRQVIFDANGGTGLKAFRTSGGGDAIMDSGGMSTTVAGQHDDGTFVFTGEPGNTSVWQKDGGAYGTGTVALAKYASGGRLFIGSEDGDKFLDGTLDSIHLWAAELSPKTIDLIWQTINEDDTDFSTDVRAPMSNVIWTDLTGDAALDQYDRLRPQTGFPHRYIRVNLPSSPAVHRVQVAAAVDGIAEPDANLGGDLFTYSFAEIPGPPFIQPVLTQDSGWSSIADFALNQEGHYTLVVTRASGGSVVLHFDVQVA